MKPQITVPPVIPSECWKVFLMLGEGRREKRDSCDATREVERVGVRIDEETYELIRRNEVDLEEAIRLLLSRLGRRG